MNERRSAAVKANVRHVCPSQGAAFAGSGGIAQAPGKHADTDWRRVSRDRVPVTQVAGCSVRQAGHPMQREVERFASPMPRPILVRNG